jgi:hypothetical protein
LRPIPSNISYSEPEDEPDKDEVGVTRITPPPEQRFEDYNKGLKFIYQWAKEHGIDYSKAKSFKNKDKIIYKQLMRCTRWGKLNNTRYAADLLLHRPIFQCTTSISKIGLRCLLGFDKANRLM